MSQEQEMDDIDEIMAEEFAAEKASPQGGNGSDESGSMPQLPDGMGLDYEDVRMMLAMKHETAISLDDPILESINNRTLI